MAILPRGTRLVRIYAPPRHWNGRRSWGPHPEGRFDHHEPPPGTASDRSVWYASRSLLGAVAEAFGKRGFVDRAAGEKVALCRVAAPIRLVDLVGVAARRVGLTQEVAATTDYAPTQEWARALYAAYDGLSGIRWRGRQSGSISIVLTDRADMRRLALETDLAVTDPRVWPRIARAALRCSLQVV